MDLGNSSVKPIKLLGKGGFGCVFLCRYFNKCDVCVKRIAVKNTKAHMKMIMEEIYIISQMNHPHIIRFFNSFAHAGTVNIIMEYAPNGTLRDLIMHSQPNGFSAEKILCYFCDILMGLEYLHIRNVIHRDLKPANLLLDANYFVKIADFGISLVHDPHRPERNSSGTPYYQAPEVLLEGKIDYKSDVWALGCILYEMCVGHSPFAQADSVQNLYHLIQNLKHHKLDCKQINQKYGPMWAKLCERMVRYHIKHRISLTEILAFDAQLTIPFYNKYFCYSY